MAVSAKELEVIRADIMIAGTAMQQKDNPIMVNMAAYHFAQAIEKSIKAIISEKSVEPPPQETMYAHNMEHLLFQAERVSPNFIQEHMFIADNAQTLSAFNGLRYGDKCVSKADAFVLMKNAKDLFWEIENAYMKELGVKQEAIADHAHIQIFDATRLSLDDKNSTWKKQNGKNYHGAGKADHGKKSYGKHYQKPKYQKEQYDKCDD